MWLQTFLDIFWFFLPFMFVTAISLIFFFLIEKKKVEEDDEMAELAAWAN